MAVPLGLLPSKPSSSIAVIITNLLSRISFIRVLERMSTDKKEWYAKPRANQADVAVLGNVLAIA